MKHIPNTITCLNLLAGCMACIMILRVESYLGAFIFIAMAALFDFLDGFAARMLKAYSKLGAQLDSLADVVSFGVAPGFIVYTYLQSFDLRFTNSLAIIALLIPIFAAVRLAKFNIDTRQTDSFWGLPVPANGLFWTSFVMAMQDCSFDGFYLSLIIIALVIVFSLLMVSEIPMFSLKFKHSGWKGNEWAISFLVLSALIIIGMSSSGLFFLSICSIIGLYILLSLIKSFIPHGKK